MRRAERHAISRRIFRLNIKAASPRPSSASLAMSWPFPEIASHRGNALAAIKYTIFGVIMPSFLQYLLACADESCMPFDNLISMEATINTAGDARRRYVEALLARPPSNK